MFMIIRKPLGEFMKRIKNKINRHFWDNFLNFLLDEVAPRSIYVAIRLEIILKKRLKSLLVFKSFQLTHRDNKKTIEGRLRA